MPLYFRFSPVSIIFFDLPMLMIIADDYISFFADISFFLLISRRC